MQNYYHTYRENIRSKRRLEFNLRKIKESGLFNRDWYLGNNFDNKLDIKDPELHYLLEGANKGMNPNPLFHTSFYMAANKDLNHKNINPLIHFIEHGAREGRNPNPLFDTSWYTAKYLRELPNSINPLAHFLSNNNAPSEKFDVEWYVSNYDLGCVSAPEALIHYFSFGIKNGFSSNITESRSTEDNIRKIRDSLIFNEDTYASLNRDVLSVSPRFAEHYYFHGAQEGRSFNPIFDLNWYSHQLAGLDLKRINPVLHYLDQGANLGVSPSTWFDATWYVETYPNWGSLNMTPLEHFLLRGGIETSPSPRFDAVAYYRDYPEVAAAGINPLEHYLCHGLREGRRVRPVKNSNSGSADVSRSKIATVKLYSSTSKQSALMVTHAPNGKIKGHVEHYIKALIDNKISVVLIVAADQRKTSIPKSIIDLCDGVFVRENSGYDFAAWAHVIAENEQLLSLELLVLVNDSLIGPLNSPDFKKMLGSIQNSGNDIVGLTDNYHYAWHAQSFFLALKRSCLSSYAFNRYIQNISALNNKDAVILEYELTLSMQMIAQGLTIDIIFPMRKSSNEIKVGPGISDKEHNRTILEWDWMLRGGFPFLKGSLVNGEHKMLFGDAPRLALAERNFDIDCLDPGFFYKGIMHWADLESEATFSEPLKISFIGPTSYKNGLGVAARSYLKALYSTPYKLNILPIEAPFHVHSRISPTWQVKSFAGQSDVVLIHINGDGWNALLSDDQKFIVSKAKIKIGLFVWETSVIPNDWLTNINRLDAIWVPTKFCADIFRKVTDIPIYIVPYVVENNPSPQIDSDVASKLRLTYKLDSKRRIILYAFDGSSFLARKNPNALIAAFRQSGLYGRGWQLVLKTKHVFDIPTEGEKLFELVGRSGDVKVIDQPMNDNDFKNLFNLSDIYASSHSSEGFGLTIAEAMEIGKIVVATDYGGSRDFLDETCGFPVKAEVIKLSESYGPYIQGSEWGRVDQNDLTRALCAAAITDANSEIGKAAKARVRSHLSIDSVARAIKNSLETITSSNRNAAGQLVNRLHQDDSGGD